MQHVMNKFGYNLHTNQSVMMIDSVTYNGIRIYNELIYTYPNHICNNNVDENGMTKTRKMILKS